jgi:hypothetical protein
LALCHGPVKSGAQEGKLRIFEPDSLYPEPQTRRRFAD